MNNKTIDKELQISKTLWSLGGADNTWEKQQQYANFYEFVVTPIWLKSEGIEHLPELGDANWKEHIDIRFWRPGVNDVHTCDVKAPRKGPKGMFVGVNEFTNDICVEYINKNGDPGSLEGKQDWSFYYVVDDYEYYLVGIKQSTLRAWVDSLIASGKVSSPDKVENMSERAKTHRGDMYYRWYRTPGDEDSFMFVPFPDILDSGVVYFTRNVTDCVRQAYDLMMANGGVSYLKTFKYQN